MKTSRFNNYSNIELVDYFDVCCSELTKAVNFAPKYERKWSKEHAAVREELIKRLNKDERL